MFLFALLFLTGDCVLQCLPTLPTVNVENITLLAACICGACLFGVRKRTRLLCIGLCGLLAGFLFAGVFAAARISERWPDSKSGTDVELAGYVSSLVVKSDESQRFEFTTQIDQGHSSVPPRIELTSYDNTVTFRPGELWRLKVRLRSPRGFANPGGYDYEAQLLREGIGATGYVRESSTNQRVQVAKGFWILRAREAIAWRLESALGDSPMLGVILGLVVGDTSKMSSEQWRVFSLTGTTHLMAISGMHIGMVALGLAWLAGRCARRLSLQRRGISIVGIESMMGMGAAACYSALAGLSIPTQRTLAMLCVFFGTRLLRRHLSPTRGFAIALVGVLLIDPFAPLAPGFWLSFGAVAAIFLATVGSISRPTWFKEYAHLQWVATVGLSPLVIAAFGSLSLISPFVNLLAIPFFTLLIVPLALAGTALLFLIESIGAKVLHLAVLLMEWTWPGLLWFSRLPFAAWSLAQAPPWAVAMLVLGAALIVAPGIRVTRLAGLLLCLPALLWQPERPRDGEFRLAMLDVGQGLALIVATREHVLVYDTGPSFRSGRDTGELVVAPYLQSQGVRRVDTVVISHGDSDHVGGLKGFLDRIQADQLLLGPSVEPHANSRVCAPGQSWRWDEVRFEILYPPPVPGKARRNDSSCVLRVDGIGGSALLMGDAERNSEEWLLTHSVPIDSDIVVVPHHGSKTSSTQQFVSAVSAKYAFVSAGFNNQWGFPKREVLERWENSGARTLQTAESGTIEVDVTQHGVSYPRLFRKEARRYWRN